MVIKMTKKIMAAVFCMSLLLMGNSQTSKKKPGQVRVYVDVICDLFHAGHINFFKLARQAAQEKSGVDAQNIYLIVGLCGDEDTASYKRLPIWNIKERCNAVDACAYVNEVLPNAPLSVTKKVLEDFDIDFVAHGSDFNEENLKKYYGAVLDRPETEFVTVPYTQGISTSETLRRILRPRKIEDKQLEAPYVAKKQPHETRIYVNMSGDLFHAKHINFIKKIRKAAQSLGYGKKINLFVGVPNNKDCKRLPIWNTKERCSSIGTCKYVDTVIPNVSSSDTDELLKKYDIDFDLEDLEVCSGFDLTFNEHDVISNTINRVLKRRKELEKSVFKK